MTGGLLGLITARDLLRQRRLPFATRDEHGRLRVGAAIGATGDYLERAAELVRAGVDVHRDRHRPRPLGGDGQGDERVPQALRARRDDRRQRRHGRGRRASWPTAAPTASRSASARAAAARTRMTTSFGVPQLQALVDCRLALGDSDVTIIADGGVRRHGAILEALLFGGDSSMLGSAFAGTEEAPGEIVHKSVMLPESQQGRSRCRSRCCAAWPRSRRSAIGWTSRMPTRWSSKRSAPKAWRSASPRAARPAPIVRDMIKHLCSSISYGGASSLQRAAREVLGRARRRT